VQLVNPSPTRIRRALQCAANCRGSQAADVIDAAIKLTQTKTRRCDCSSLTARLVARRGTGNALGKLWSNIIESLLVAAVFSSLNRDTIAR